MSQHAKTDINPSTLDNWLDRLSAYAAAHGALLRAELREKGHGMKMAIMALIGGSVMLIASLVILLQALVAVLQALGLSAGWASVAIGGGAFVIAGLTIASAVDKLSFDELMPNRSMAQAKKDLATIKELK